MHYEGWSSRWDERVPLRKAQPIDGDQATARLLQQKCVRPSPPARKLPLLSARETIQESRRREPGCQRPKKLRL